MNLKSKKRKIRFQIYFLFPICILLATLVPYISWHGILQHEEKLEFWFQRSGSLTVIFAVLAELILFNISSYMGLGKTIGDAEDAQDLNEIYGCEIKFFKSFAAIIAIVGTIIWGYGDLIWLYMN